MGDRKIYISVGDRETGLGFIMKGLSREGDEN
jgi:hypothetical protein